MSIESIAALGFSPMVTPSISGSEQADRAASIGAANRAGTSSSAAFGDMVLSGLDHLERVQDRSDQLAVNAATGDLNAIHDYTIAATEAGVTTQLTVAVRNKAVEAFTEIMRMQI